jgi:hypothetical protein
MSRNHEPDDLMSALADLPRANPDRVRSEALIARATRTIARRRARAEQRLNLLAGIYVRVVEPVAACALSAAFLAAVLVQAIVVITQAHTGYLWR